jgi:hypothetical protein
MEITDEMVQMFIEILRKLERSTERQVDREIVRDFKQVNGKPQILYRVACAAIKEPDGKVADVIFKCVKEEVFRDIVVEYESDTNQGYHEESCKNIL